MPDTNECEDCGEHIDDDFTSLIEAFEVTGRVLCASCAEDAFAEGE